MSKFAHVQPGQPIEIFQVNQACTEDKNTDKVNLSIGAFRTDDCKPWVLPVVKKVELELANEINGDKLNHEYLPMTGLESFTVAATALILGKDNELFKSKKALGIQCISGTGSVKEAIDFYKVFCGSNIMYISNPTWGNHRLMGKQSGFEVKEYKYWNPLTKDIDFDGMCQDIKNAPDNSLIILHACAHNPTGIDPTKEQWNQLSQLFLERPLLHILFDSAYQGFASGDINADAYSVRLFGEKEIEFMVAQSFAKNFGLYNERIGNLTVVTRDPSVTENIKSQIKLLIRGNYSNPPAHGARIVERILNNPLLYNEWMDCVRIMATRIIGIRHDLRVALEKLGTPGTWNHVTDQIGMFSFTGLTPTQVDHLKTDWHIYMLRNGRISLCGLNKSNVNYVAKAICDVVKKFPSELH